MAPATAATRQLRQDSCDKAAATRQLQQPLLDDRPSQESSGPISISEFKFPIATVQESQKTEILPFAAHVPFRLKVGILYERLPSGKHLYHPTWPEDAVDGLHEDNL